jgi:hypothetical protein
MNTVAAFRTGDSHEFFDIAGASTRLRLSAWVALRRNAPHIGVGVPGD